jgi:hypothetical protein
VSRLDEARARLQDRKTAPEPPPWRFPVMDDFYQALRVLAWDATLSHCGWCLLEVLGGEVAVHAKGCINPKTPRTGFFETWDKAYELRWHLTEILEAYPHEHRVIEAPSVGGGYRTESSLIAGMLVWMERPKLCTVVSATRVSSVLLGDPRIPSEVRKPAIRKAVIRLIPAAVGRDWNEHIRDAAATGLTHLHDWKTAHTQHTYVTGV